MKLTHPQRLRIAHEVRRQLPWAHIVVGAPRYNFIEVSRGEAIKGSFTTSVSRGKGGQFTGFGGAAWSRGWPGSYCLNVDFGEEWAESRRHMEPMRGESERMIVTKRWTLPTGSKGQTPAVREKMMADWIVTKAVWFMHEAPRDESLLRKHERFEVAVNELEPLTTRKAVRK